MRAHELLTWIDSGQYDHILAAGKVMGERALPAQGATRFCSHGGNPVKLAAAFCGHSGAGPSGPTVVGRY